MLSRMRRRTKVIRNLKGYYSIVYPFTQIVVSRSSLLYFRFTWHFISHFYLSVRSRQFIGSDLLMPLIYDGCCCCYYKYWTEAKKKTRTSSLSLFMILVHVYKDHCLILFHFSKFFFFFLLFLLSTLTHSDPTRCTRKKQLC
jgi:hypothetical protein